VSLSEKKLHPDYYSHDFAYQKRRKDGYPGWDEADVMAQSIKDMDSLLGRLKLEARSKVLDLGCGAGNLSFWLEEKGFAVYGCDISETAIEWAKELAGERGSSVGFQVADATKTLAYPSKFFDLVMDNHCLHCIIGEDREHYLKEVYRVLKPGAFYILSTMCSDSSHPIGVEGFDPVTRCIVKGDTAIRYIGLARDIIQEITRSGLALIHQEISLSDGAELFVIAVKSSGS